MNSSRMVEKLAEAQQIFHAGQSQPLPKTELVLEPLLRNVHTVHYLREFYEAEYSIENLDLWFAVERFRQTSDAKQRAIEAENIYETYICENAPRQVNLPMKLVKTLAKNVKERDPTDENEPASDIFDECAKECFTLLQSRFEKFVSSKFGQALRARLRGTLPAHTRIVWLFFLIIIFIFSRCSSIRTIRGGQIGPGHLSDNAQD